MKAEKNITIFMVAGEVSGDMYGALLARALYRINPHLIIYGIGGEKMQEAGVRLILNSLSISVVGFTELFSKIGKIIATFKAVKKFIIQNKPSAVVLIDYPGFNLRLARIIKREKIPVIYYVSPQVWAWRKKRAGTLISRVDRLVVILPFEKDWYHKEGYYNVDYFGHPLVEILKNHKNKEEIKKGKSIVGILPGSRYSEIKRILPVMLKTAKLIRTGNKVHFVLPLAPGIKESSLSRYLKKSNVKIEIYKKGSLPVIKSADLILVASGTATLEASYFQTPMIVIYKISFFSYLLARILVRTPWIGLVNLIAGENIAPEFIQWKAKPRKIAKIAMDYLKDKKKVEEVKKKLLSVKEKIEGENTSIKVARVILDFCKER